MENKTQIFFSILVTSYNYEKFIGQTLNSIVNQTYKNYEVIIVDDGSKDNSVSIIKQYTEKFENFKLYQHENNENKGIVASIKLALSKAKGEYITFLESDDYWHADYLMEKEKYIQQNNKTVLLCNAIQTIGEKSADEYIEKITKILSNKSNTNKHFYYMYKYNIIPTLSCVCIKKSELEKCNLNPIISAWFDYWVYRQIVFDYPIDFINKKLTFWRIHKDSYNNKSEEDERNTFRLFKQKSNKLLQSKNPLKFMLFLVRKFFKNF